jgi:hypothetical protein
LKELKNHDLRLCLIEVDLAFGNLFSIGLLFKKQGTINLDKDMNDNSELMKRLRAWKIAKRTNEEKAYAEKVAKCEVDLDEAQTKIMILKLLQTEKMLKEIRR